MRILVVTKHLAEYAGSELFTRDLCLELVHRGHRVACFAWESGAVSSELAGRGVTVVSDLRALSGRDFDVIHAQHGVAALLARSAFPDVPMAYFVHGVISAFEHLPGIELGVAVFGGVSEETARDVASRYGLPASEVRIIRNPVDTDRFDCGRSLPSVPRNLLILSNHLSADVRRTIGIACDRAGIAVSHVGLPENPRLDVEHCICQADIVVTLGRGALEAMSCGRNLIVYDRNGGDGFVDTESLFCFRERNFSGRTGRRRFTAESFGRELAKYDPSISAIFREYVMREHSVSAMGDLAEHMYHDAIVRGVPSSPGFVGRVVLRYPFALWYVHGMFLANRCRKIARILRIFGYVRDEDLSRKASRL